LYLAYEPNSLQSATKKISLQNLQGCAPKKSVVRIAPFQMTAFILPYAVKKIFFVHVALILLGKFIMCMFQSPECVNDLGFMFHVSAILGMQNFA
jgi:hypothetical protein